MTALPGTPFSYTEDQWKSIEDATGVCCCKYRAMMEALPEKWIPKGQKHISRSARFAEERRKLSVIQEALKIVHSDLPPDPSEAEYYGKEEDYR